MKTRENDTMAEVGRTALGVIEGDVILRGRRENGAPEQIGMPVVFTYGKRR